MKKSLSATNFSLVQRPSMPKVMKKSVSYDVLYPLEVIGIETLTHVSLKTAHDCALAYPAFPDTLININTQVQSNNANANANGDNEKLAICLATPDDSTNSTVSSKLFDQTCNQDENRIGEFLVRVRRRMRNDKNRASVDGQ